MNIEKYIKNTNLKYLLISLILAVIVCNKDFIIRTFVANKVEKFKPDIQFLSSLLPIICEANSMQDDYNWIADNFTEARTERVKKRIIEICDRAINICNIIDKAPAKTADARRVKEVLVSEFSHVRNVAEPLRMAYNKDSFLAFISAIRSAVTLVDRYPRIIEHIQQADREYENYILERIDEELGTLANSALIETNKSKIAHVIRETVLEIAREKEIFATNQRCLTSKLNEIDQELDRLIVGKSISSRLPMKRVLKAFNDDSPINLRNRPRTDSKLLTKVPMGEEVILHEINGDWGRITYGDFEGWIKNPIVNSEEVSTSGLSRYLCIPITTLLLYFLIQISIQILKNRKLLQNIK